MNYKMVFNVIGKIDRYLLIIRVRCLRSHILAVIPRVQHIEGIKRRDERVLIDLEHSRELKMVEGRVDNSFLHTVFFGKLGDIQGRSYRLIRASVHCIEPHSIANSDKVFFVGDVKTVLFFIHFNIPFVILYLIP